MQTTQPRIAMSPPLDDEVMENNFAIIMALQQIAAAHNCVRPAVRSQTRSDNEVVWSAQIGSYTYTVCLYRNCWGTCNYLVSCRYTDTVIPRRSKHTRRLYRAVKERTNLRVFTRRCRSRWRLRLRKPVQLTLTNLNPPPVY
jgi:hypothetical protein